jgi:hypothetical protein
MSIFEGGSISGACGLGEPIPSSTSNSALIGIMNADGQEKMSKLQTRWVSESGLLNQRHSRATTSEQHNHSNFQTIQKCLMEYARPDDTSTHALILSSLSMHILAPAHIKTLYTHSRRTALQRPQPVSIVASTSRNAVNKLIQYNNTLIK